MLQIMTRRLSLDAYIDVKSGVGNGVLTSEFTGRNPGFSLAENTDDLFVGKTLLHGDVLMWLMKTLLTSRCVNQLGAGQCDAMRILGMASRFLCSSAATI